MMTLKEYAARVEARASAAKSAMVKSVSWPTQEITGMREAAMARATISSLKGQRSSSEPPPRPTSSTSGRLFTGQTSVLPCTPAGCMELLRRANVKFSGKHAVVVGRSNIVGKPMAMLLLNEHCTVTVCHSRTKDLARFTRDADILVAAVGRPGMITGDMIKPGAAVIDVGINRLDNGKLMGDVDFESAEPVAGAITPVPGGVGPMTIAMLMQNAILAAEKRHG